MTWPNLMDSNSALCAKMVRPGMAVRKCPPLLDFAVALGCCTHDDVSSRIGYPRTEEYPQVASSACLPRSSRRRLWIVLSVSRMT